MAQAEAFFFFVSALFFVVIFYWPWQRLCVDWSRQLMFEERDRLFLLTQSSELIPVNSELHAELRMLIDRMIRYCHRLTWYSLLLNTALRKNDKRASSRALYIKKLIDVVPDKAIRDELHDIIVYVRVRGMYDGEIYNFRTRVFDNVPFESIE
jgi:hypothetical protein